MVLCWVLVHRTCTCTCIVHYPRVVGPQSARAFYYLQNVLVVQNRAKETSHDSCLTNSIQYSISDMYEANIELSILELC